MVNHISLNIKVLREKNNLSQAAFGRLFDIKTQAISHYERGENLPKIDTLIKISEHYNLSLDELVTKNLLTDTNFLDNEQTTRRTPVNLFVSANHYEDYKTGMFLKSSEVRPERLKIPRMSESKNPRTFEMKGDKMKPVLYNGDLIVTEKIENLSEITGGQIYVIVTYLKGIIIRWVNVDEQNQRLSVYSEEKNNLPETIDFRDIKEIWRGVGRVCYHFSESNINERVNELETFVEKLKVKFPEL